MQSLPPRQDVRPDGVPLLIPTRSRMQRTGRFAWLWIWRWFHVSFRIGRPFGLGLRVFFWWPETKDASSNWSASLDVLTPLFDLQIGFHRPRVDA